MHLVNRCLDHNTAKLRHFLVFQNCGREQSTELIDMCYIFTDFGEMKVSRLICKCVVLVEGNAVMIEIYFFIEVPS